VHDVRVRILQDTPVANARELLGNGELLTRFNDQKPVNTGCWVTFTPPPELLPRTTSRPRADRRALHRAHGPGRDHRAREPAPRPRRRRVVPAADTIVVGQVGASPDLRRFTLTPTLPLSHSGKEERYHLLMGALTDLAGNGLVDAPEEITFTIDPAQPRTRTAGAWCASTTSRTPARRRPDFRGQFFYDLEHGRIRPRRWPSVHGRRPHESGAVDHDPVRAGRADTARAARAASCRACGATATSAGTCATRPSTTSTSSAFAGAPVGGTVISDFYENFEIRLAHSRWLPDECISRNLLPQDPNSGPGGRPAPVHRQHPERPALARRSRARAPARLRLHPGRRVRRPTGTVFVPTRSTARPRR
jgi:hypothetical protein